MIDGDNAEYKLKQVFPDSRCIGEACYIGKRFGRCYQLDKNGDTVLIHWCKWPPPHDGGPLVSILRRAPYGINKDGTLASANDSSDVWCKIGMKEDDISSRRNLLTYETGRFCGEEYSLYINGAWCSLDKEGKVDNLYRLDFYSNVIFNDCRIVAADGAKRVGDGYAIKKDADPPGGSINKTEITPAETQNMLKNTTATCPSENFP